MKKILLREEDIPRQWYNPMVDIPNGVDPALDPETKQPMAPEKMAVIFPENLLAQEMSTDRWIDIPEPILEIWASWRPSPLYRADMLEKALGTKARIYYKYEGSSPSGSHKTNTAVAQTYYNSVAGVTRLATETGAGQWGSALSFATQKFGMECKVYMVRCSYEQKPYRKSMMQCWGGTVVPSPSPETAAGRMVLEMDPDCPGALGIAISEAVEDAATHDNTKYALGSVLNHVCIHQTCIGLEVKKQLELIGEKVDVVVGCCGGGSNFAGIAAPFIPDILEGKKIRLVGVEPAACPTLTKGQYAYDYGDMAKMTPLLRMHTLGHDFIPPGIHAGGLRYHGMAPIVSAMLRENLMEACSVHQVACFEAGVLFAKTEGIIPAPESTHALRAAIDEAMKDPNEPKVIVFNLSGHGLLDLSSYDKYFSGGLEDYAHPADAIAVAQSHLPKM